MDAKSEARLFALLDTISLEVAKIGPMATEVAKIGPMAIEIAKIGPMAADVAALKVEVSDLRSETRDGFDRIERRMGNLETRIEVLEDRHRGIETH